MEDAQNKIINNRTMPDCSIFPVLKYADIIEAAEWLCKVFGLKKKWHLVNHRILLEYNNGAVMLSDKKAGDAEAHISTHGVIMRIKDINAHYQNAIIHGAHILQPPTDYPYGERQYNVADIGGHIWTFSESIADLAPEDWGGDSDKH